MTPNPWFRMYHEFATDPKVQMLSEVDQRRFVMLLCIDAECPKCAVSGGGEFLECDHVIPVTRGGDHRDSNLVTACRPCNLAKRDRVVTINEWKQTRSAKQ